MERLVSPSCPRNRRIRAVSTLTLRADMAGQSLGGCSSCLSEAMNQPKLDASMLVEAADIKKALAATLEKQNALDAAMTSELQHLSQAEEKMYQLSELEYVMWMIFCSNMLPSCLTFKHDHDIDRERFE